MRYHISAWVAVGQGGTRDSGLGTRDSGLGTTGPRDHGTTGPRDHGTTGPRDHGTTGPREKRLTLARPVKPSVTKMHRGCGMKRKSRAVAHGCAVECDRGAVKRAEHRRQTQGKGAQCLSTWMCELAPACGCREAQGPDTAGAVAARVRRGHFCLLFVPPKSKPPAAGGWKLLPLATALTPKPSARSQLMSATTTRGCPDVQTSGLQWESTPKRPALRLTAASLS